MVSPHVSQTHAPVADPVSGTACWPCRQRKVKCNNKLPCENCVKREHPQLCSYRPNRSAANKKDAAPSQQCRKRALSASDGDESRKTERQDSWPRAIGESQCTVRHTPSCLLTRPCQPTWTTPSLLATATWARTASPPSSASNRLQTTDPTTSICAPSLASTPLLRFPSCRRCICTAWLATSRPSCRATEKSSSQRPACHLPKTLRLT